MMKRLQKSAGLAVMAWVSILLATGTIVTGQIAVGPGFTYQGLLEDAGQPANGNFDMEFRLFGMAAGGSAVVPAVLLNDVSVVDGRFTVELDFGADAFDGDARWLQVEVESIVLGPRQAITATPYSTKTRGIHVSNDESFVGVGRDFPLAATEAFGIYDNTNGLGGMNIETDPGGSPYYGYSSGGAIDAHHFVDGATGNWNLNVNGDNRISVNANDGFVGIGRDQRVSGSEVFGLFSSATSGFRGMYIQTQGEDAQPFYGYAAGGAADAYHYYEGSTGNWRLWNGGERIAVSNDGYVGIGRDTPVVDDAQGQSWFDVKIPASTDAVGGMYVENASAGKRTVYGYAANGVSKAVMSFDDQFNTWALDIGPSVTDELVVKGDTGRVGISTFNPTALLDVNGSMHVATNLSVGLSACKPGGGTWSSCSDRRLKKNVADLDGSLEKLLQLRGVTFEFKDPKAFDELEGQRIGMIAQEVEKVFPDWVEERSDGYKTLGFRGFEALTVEALRELREEKDTQIESLEQENDDLRERLESLEAAVESLTAQSQQR